MGCVVLSAGVYVHVRPVGEFKISYYTWFIIDRWRHDERTAGLQEALKTHVLVIIFVTASC
jgi:hypothetical protein